MKKKIYKDVLGILHDFQETLVENKPTLQEMYEQIRMMRFKVRPVHGDVSLINLADVKLIEALWNLGKLEEMYRRELIFVSRQDKKVFSRFFDHFNQHFQKELNKISLKIQYDYHEEEDDSSIVEMEIFKEKTAKGKFN